MQYLGFVFQVGELKFWMGGAHLDHPKYTVTVYFRVGESKFRVGAAHPARPVDKSLARSRIVSLPCRLYSTFGREDVIFT